MKFTVTQKLHGRKKGKRCVAPTKKLRHAKRCTRTITLGGFTRSAGAGANRVPFNGRVNGRTLNPSSYKLGAAPHQPVRQPWHAGERQLQDRQALARFARPPAG